MSNFVEPMPAIAICGLGGIFPDAPNIAAYWDNICRNHVAIGNNPEDRWQSALFYDAQVPHADKSYTRVGGFVRDYHFDAKFFRIPPKTAESLDKVQHFALIAVRAALEDAGFSIAGEPTEKSFDRHRCAVIFGNTMGGELQSRTSLRIWGHEIQHYLRQIAQELGLNASLQTEIQRKFIHLLQEQTPIVTEDTMPGELPNCITGRICNALDLKGPNFTVDAACASSLLALQVAIEGLLAHTYDTAIVGGADRSMDPPTYVKFCRLGALAKAGSFPFDERADGFVMGEGAGAIVLKRWEDALAEGLKIYAVIRGIGSSSDGRGKGIAAPNESGQRRAIVQAWKMANQHPSIAHLFEAHGTATVIGDMTELRVLDQLLAEAPSPLARKVPIGSVKSMIGHLKSAAGIASLIKTSLALYHRVIPPSAQFTTPPADSPVLRNRIYINTSLQPLPSLGSDGLYWAGVSSFGFGGINCHVVLSSSSSDTHQTNLSPNEDVKPTTSVAQSRGAPTAQQTQPAPLSRSTITERVLNLFAEKTGYSREDLQLDYQLEADLGIDTVKIAEILAIIRTWFPEWQQNATLASPRTLQELLNAIPVDEPSLPTSIEQTASPVEEQVGIWTFSGEDLQALWSYAHAELGRRCGPDLLTSAPEKNLFTLGCVANNAEDAQRRFAQVQHKKESLQHAQGIFVHRAQDCVCNGKIAFVFPGQGSQYLGMLSELAEHYPVVGETFAEADRCLRYPFSLRDVVWAKPSNPQALEEANARLQATEYCQPIMLVANIAIHRLLHSLGIVPNMVAGHSLGEWAAAVAAGILSFGDALVAVSVRGTEMSQVEVLDKGKMAAVACGGERIDAVLAEIPYYVVAANKNCHTQTVIAGETIGIEKAIQAFQSMGVDVRPLAVSHAFHSRIVAPAQEPLRRVLHKLHISAPKYPIYTNITGTLYPETPDAIIDIMAEQLARPVEFIQEIENMYADGARIFIEVGPKRALTGMIRNILDTRPHLALACNHPKKNDLFALMETLAALRTHHLQWRVPSTKSSTTALARPSEKTLAYRPPAKEELVISSWSLLAGSSKSSQMDMSTWRPVLQQLLREAGVPTGEATLLPDAWQKDTGLMWLMPHAHRQFAFLSSMTASLGILGPQMHLPTDFLAGNEGMLWSMDWLRSRRCRRVLVVERYEDAWGVLLLERAEDLLHRGCHAQAALLPDFSGTRQDWQEELKLQLPEFCAQPFADEQMSSPSHILLLGQAPTRKPSLTKAGGGGGMAAILALQQFQQQPDLDLCLHCVPQLASQMAVMTYRCLQRDHESRIADRQKHGHFIEALQASNTSLLHWSEQALLPSPQDADLPLASTFATRLQEVTALFADHTGYQIDDLLPDYQLEADLGIDTVKQAELLSVLRDRYPALADRLTGELTTLRQIAQALVLEPVQEQPLAEQPMAANTAVSQEISIVREEAESASSDWEDKALTDWLLELFAQHTGYEKADLGLDYALEGDLGIDTVKQAEILSLVRQRYALASDKPLAAFPTIRAILAALKENHLEASSLTEHSQTSTATQALSPVQPSNITIQSVRLQKIKAPEGRYPIEGKSVVVVANSTNAQKGLLVELQAMAAEVMRYYTWAEALAQPMEAWAKCELLLMVLPDAQEAFHPEHSQAQVLEAIALTQRLGQSHRGAAKMPDIFVLGLNGGGFGCGSAKPQAWALAGVAGMLKTLAKEWPKSRCLVLDWVEGPANPSLLEWQFIARQLFAVASVADVCEIAYADSAFWLPRRIEQTEHPIQLNSFTLQPADVVVATGGSQGVTFKILEQMALSGPFKLILCGRTRAVRPEESWFANAKDDSERYQHAKKILESRGERTTPAAVRAYVAAEQARLDIYNNQMRLQSLGCELHFYPIDVTNTARLDTLQKTILNHHGSVRLLIHGAGIEESKYLIDKTLPTMQMVLAVKAQAAWQMWETLQPDRMITMGSVSARYGNAGQADYAAANEMMAAMARTANINGDKRQWLNIGWSAWKDIGMATRGSVQQVLEGMGVELINLQEGVRLAASLIQSHWTHDVVVAGHLGSFNRSDFVPLAEEPQTPADRPLFDHMNQTPQGGLLAMHRSGLDTHPALHDHRIDGTPVFPGVWGLALMKAAVAVVFAEPERGVCVLEQVEFMRPIKFFKDEPLDIWLEATPVQDGQTTLRVFTYFSDPTGRKTQHEHYRARARWQLEYPPNMRDMQQSLTATRAHSITPAMLYERYFHGKAFQVLSHIDALTDTSVAARPDITIEWSIAPHMQQALLGVEAGFQLCGLWQMLESREVCLPSAIEQVVWPMGQVTVGRIAIEEDLACETPQFCIRVESCNPAEASTDGIYLSGYRTRWWRPLAIQEHFSGEDYTPSLQKTGQIRLNETTQSLHEQESENYLSPSEWAEYQAFTFDKRRTEWLAARILAKKILQHVAQRYFSPVDLKAISLTKDAHGKPQWTGPYAWLSDCQLSLSHTEDWVWVVLNWQHGCYVGIDVEKVTERHPRFALDYLTPGEQAMAALAAEQSHVLHTQLWACKEAYMKALGLGARLSFTDIEVLLDTTPIQVHLVGEAKRRFVDLHIVGSDVHLTTYTKQHESTHVVASVCLYTEPTQQRLFSDTVASGAQSLCQ